MSRSNVSDYRLAAENIVRGAYQRVRSHDMSAADAVTSFVGMLADDSDALNRLNKDYIKEAYIAIGREVAEVVQSEWCRSCS